MPKREPEPDSPFAAFATPDHGGIEGYQARRRNAGRARRSYWGFIAAAAAGGTCGAAAGAIGLAGSAILPAAMAFSALGAILGVAAGFLLGSIAWAGLIRSSRASPATQEPGAMLFQDNSWDKLILVYQVWVMIGIVFGAGGGAACALPGGDREPIVWGLTGALVGMVVALAFRHYTGRKPALTVG